MTISQTLLQKEWMFVVYDVKTSSNNTRNWIRRKLVYYWGAVMHTQSVYLVPKSVATVEELQTWANDTDVDLEIISLDLTEDQVQSFSQKYVTELHQRLEEVRDFAKSMWKELKEKEEDIDNPELKWTGFHKKVEGVQNQFEYIQRLISRYGNEDNEFELQTISLTVDKLAKRFEKLKEHKFQRIDEGYGID